MNDVKHAAELAGRTFTEAFLLGYKEGHTDGDQFGWDSRDDEVRSWRAKLDVALAREERLEKRVQEQADRIEELTADGDELWSQLTEAREAALPNPRDLGIFVPGTRVKVVATGETLERIGINSAWAGAVGTVKSVTDVRRGDAVITLDHVVHLAYEGASETVLNLAFEHLEEHVDQDTYDAPYQATPIPRSRLIGLLDDEDR